MPAPPNADPDALAFARERRAAGVSFQAIAAEMTGIGFKVSAMTLSRWLAEPGAPKEKRGPKRKAEAQRFHRSAPPDPPAEPPPPEDEPLLDFMRRQLRVMKGDADQARQVNPVLYQRLTRDMVILSNNLARLERDQPDDADVLRFSRREIDAGIVSLQEKMGGWIDRCAAAGGLLCARCSRELSVDLGTAPAPSGLAGPSPHP